MLAVISPSLAGTAASSFPSRLATMPCRIEFTIIGMTVTDWSFTFRCSPPHLAVTQFLQVTAQSTFGLDRTFTFLFHNPHRRTGKLARERSSSNLGSCGLWETAYSVPSGNRTRMCIRATAQPENDQSFRAVFPKTHSRSSGLKKSISSRTTESVCAYWARCRETGQSVLHMMRGPPKAW